MGRLFVLMSLIAFPLPLVAQSGPPPEFFAGTFEMTGRTASGEPVADWVRISSHGGELKLDACRAGEGQLDLRPRGEHQLPLTGTLGEQQIACDFQVTLGNYARLNCFVRPEGDNPANGPGLLTLWPVNWDKPALAADCAD